mmetsp:Transcript_7416/g.21601  ORF Transcript_7416/g.21601 Transcript_7416/m.21601 type:complete len:435 (-) Transcript_7416:190-1494(-)
MRVVAPTHTRCWLPLVLVLLAMQAAPRRALLRPSISPAGAAAACGCRFFGGGCVRRAVAAAGEDSLAAAPAGELLGKLDEKDWEARRAAFEARLEPVLAQRSTDHPIFNFVWKYYMLKPRQLLRWSPGSLVLLEGFDANANTTASGRSYYKDGWRPAGDGGYYDPRLVKPAKVPRLAWAREVLASSARRPPLLNCYGLHEWAMLYAPPDGLAVNDVSVHQRLPLRLSQAELNAAVEARPLRCTHADAVRFFAAEALPKLTSYDREAAVRGAGEDPMDILASGRGAQATAKAMLAHSGVPNRELQPAFEQPGCVHATMDLFKWSSKLAPFIDSDLVGDCLDLAIEARTLDMRASPYDLYAAVERLGEENWGAFDPSPVRIETPEGQEEYADAQVELYHKAKPMRRRVIDAYDEFLACWPELEGRTQTPGVRPLDA